MTIGRHRLEKNSSGDGRWKEEKQMSALWSDLRRHYNMFYRAARTASTKIAKIALYSSWILDSTSGACMGPGAAALLGGCKNRMAEQWHVSLDGGKSGGSTRERICRLVPFWWYFCITANCDGFGKFEPCIMGDPERAKVTAYGITASLV